MLRRIAITKANDSIDRRLISLLQANARESTTTLAKRLGIARTTVQERLARLQRNGTISGYSVVLKRDPFEQYAEALLLLSVSHRRQRAVTEHLRTFPEIKLCQTINGDYELMCRVQVAELGDVAAVLESISEIPGVERMKSIVVLATNFDRSYTEAASLTSLRAAAIDRGEAG